MRSFSAIWQERHPERVAVKIAYDNALAHKIEAGADMFLMPSRYEPCGLNQIYSLRYGTVPIVRATGGLDDTIDAFDPELGPTPGRGTGFKFEEYTGEALLGAVRQALAVFEDKAAWRRLQINGMAKDFSWNASAAEYGRLYEVARKTRIRRGADHLIEGVRTPATGFEGRDGTAKGPKHMADTVASVTDNNVSGRGDRRQQFAAGHGGFLGGVVPSVPHAGAHGG